MRDLRGWRLCHIKWPPGATASMFAFRRNQLHQILLSPSFSITSSLARPPASVASTKSLATTISPLQSGEIFTVRFDLVNFTSFFQLGIRSRSFGGSARQGHGIRDRQVREPRADDLHDPRHPDHKRVSPRRRSHRQPIPDRVEQRTGT